MPRVMISLPREFLDEVDELADQEKRSRSEVIREGLRLLFKTRPFDRARAKRAFQMMRRIAKADRPGWDSIEEIRKWRKPR